MKKLAQEINSDKNFTNEAYRYMKQEFDKERAKPFEERDFDKLERLSAQMCEMLDGGSERSERPANDGMERLFEKIAEKEKGVKKSPVRKVKKFIPAAVLAAAIAAMNCISVLAWDMNIVSAVIEFTKGGFSVGFGKSDREVIELPTSEDDPYGIIAECAKYEIYPETPHYLPEGFELTSISNNVNKEYANIISFTFENSDMSISLDYKRYWNGVTNTLIPSDEYNISEIEINGSATIVSKEDNQFTAHYVKDDTAYVIFTRNVSYDECDKIVSSIK